MSGCGDFSSPSRAEPPNVKVIAPANGSGGPPPRAGSSEFPPASWATSNGTTATSPSAFNAGPRPAPSAEAEPRDPSCHQSPAGSNSPVTPTGDPTATPTIAAPGSPYRNRAFTSGGRMLSWLALSGSAAAGRGLTTTGGRPTWMPRGNETSATDRRYSRNVELLMSFTARSRRNSVTGSTGWPRRQQAPGRKETGRAGHIQFAAGPPLHPSIVDAPPGPSTPLPGRHSSKLGRRRTSRRPRPQAAPQVGRGPSRSDGRFATPATAPGAPR